MTAPTQLNPKDVADLLAKGQAVLFDVRDPDEFARRHVKGARLRPLASLESAPLLVQQGDGVPQTFFGDRDAESGLQATLETP